MEEIASLRKDLLAKHEGVVVKNRESDEENGGKEGQGHVVKEGRGGENNDSTEELRSAASFPTEGVQITLRPNLPLRAAYEDQDIENHYKNHVISGAPWMWDVIRLTNAALILCLAGVAPDIYPLETWAVPLCQVGFY